MKFKKLLSITLLLLTCIKASWGQTVLASWDLQTSTTFAPSPWDPASSDTGLIIGGFTRGSGVIATGTSAANAWGGAGYADGLAATAQTLATAINNGNFVSYTVTAKPGFKVSFTEIPLHYIRISAAAAPHIHQWQYSLDGTNFTNVGDEQVANRTTSPGDPQGPIDLSRTADLQDVPAGTTVTFRLVSYYASGDNGIWFFNFNINTQVNRYITITGTVTADPLPLTLLHFTGEQEKDANRLHWKTAKEKNIARFEIERSTDGNSYNKIAEIKATGSEDAKDNSYTYNDVPTNAATYYRLKMVDIDGSYTYSNTVVLNDTASTVDVRMYPNPTDDALYIDGLQGTVTYHIIDMTGRQLIQGQLAVTGNTTALDIGALPTGIYILHYQDAANSKAIRFAKQ